MANSLVLFCKNRHFIQRATNIVIRHSGILFIKPLGIRHLYSAASLGIEGYLQQKEKATLQLGPIASRFREKMMEYTSDDSKNMVFTEDLKNMLHLAEGDDDVKLIIKMLKRFNQQNKQMRFGNFVFGPVIMRMFHCLNKPQEAFECFKDEDLEGMFDQIMTYQIMLDLLFENQRYNEILEAFGIIKNTQIEGIKYAKNVIVLIMATCYKLNTQEFLEYALKLWKELQVVGHKPMRRAITFCAALAINQGQPEVALEILSSMGNLNYTTIRNLRVAALVDVGRLEDAIGVLKSIITEDTASVDPVQTFNHEVIDKAKLAVEKLGNSDIILEFKRVLKYLQEQGHITEMSLQTQLCQEISIPRFIAKKSDNSFIRQQPRLSRYNRDTTENRTRSVDTTMGGKFRRPGLADL